MLVFSLKARSPPTRRRFDLLLWDSSKVCKKAADGSKSKHPRPNSFQFSKLQTAQTKNKRFSDVTIAHVMSFERR